MPGDRPTRAALPISMPQPFTFPKRPSNFIVTVTCAIALLQSDGSMLKINREVNYIAGSQRELDLAYGWGMNWKSARK